MSGKSVPPRESLIAKVAREGPRLLTGFEVPLRGFEVPNDFVVPPKRLTTGLANLRCALTHSRVVRGLSAGRDEREALVPAVREDIHRVSPDVANHAWSRSLRRRKSMENVLCRHRHRRGRGCGRGRRHRHRHRRGRRGGTGGGMAFVRVGVGRW